MRSISWINLKLLDFCFIPFLQFKLLNHEYFLLDKSNNISGSTTGLYVLMSVLSILLAIAVLVILSFLQNFTNTQTIISWRRSRFQTRSHNDTQNYSNFTISEEMHQYSTMDFAKQDHEYYQNTIKSNQ